MYEWIAASHGMIGALALLTFWIAIVTRKGSRIHVSAGKVYLLAMVGVLALGVPMALVRFFRDEIVTGSFLLYLLIITATASWSSWRAIRDKQNWQRFTGPVYKLLMGLNLLSGMAMLGIGYFLAQDAKAVIMGYSLIGLIIGWRMHQFTKAPPTDNRWWLRQHISANMGNAIATHVAFLGIGVPRLFPDIAGPTLQMLAWFGPIAVATVGGIYFSRKYLKPRPQRRRPPVPQFSE